MPRCSHTYADSSQCRRIVSAEQKYCYSHAPGRAGGRRRNAARGGKAMAGESTPAHLGGYGRRGPDEPRRRRRNLSNMGNLPAGPLRRIEGTRSDGAYREVGAPGGGPRAAEGGAPLWGLIAAWSAALRSFYPSADDPLGQAAYTAAALLGLAKAGAALQENAQEQAKQAKTATVVVLLRIPQPRGWRLTACNAFSQAED